MVKKYHLSPTTGRYEACGARLRACPHGGHVTQSIYDAFNTYHLASDRQLNVGSTFQVNGYERKTTGGRGMVEIPVRVAPPATSAEYCLSCNHYFRRGNVLQQAETSVSDVTCEHCQNVSDFDDVGVDMLYGESAYLNDAIALKSSWFHITTQDNWLPTVISPDAENLSHTNHHGGPSAMVHLGSRESALDRLRFLRNQKAERHKTFYLYEVRFTAGTRMTPGLWQDQNKWPEFEDDIGRGYPTDRATRYLNRYEEPGTISLLANPKSLRQVARVEIPRELVIA